MPETPPLAVAGAVFDGETVGLRCEEGAIVALGPEVAPEPGDETIDAAGAPLVAPLVNGHTHAAMTLFRGYGSDLPLMRWLREAVWPVEEKLEPEDVYWGARLACLEMVRNGCAAFWDMYWHTGATARAVGDSGLRATIGTPLFDVDGGTEKMQEAGEAVLSRALAEAGLPQSWAVLCSVRDVYSAMRNISDHQGECARMASLGAQCLDGQLF